MSRQKTTEEAKLTEYAEELETGFARLPPWLNELSYAVIGAAMDVHSELGPGFLERVYENALLVELRDRGISVERQVEVPIRYKGALVSTARIDFIVAAELVLELKAVADLLPIHTAQLQSYLKASGLQLGLLINFQVRSLRAGIQRVIRTARGS